VNINIVDDLFLGVEELNRFKMSIFDKGFKFNLKSQTKQYGIIKNQNFDPDFNFFQVSAGSSTNSININPGYAFDADANLISQQANQPQPLILNANIWQWVKIAYIFSTAEQGTVSIGGSSGSSSPAGSNTSIMVGVGTQFTQILRGQPDYPSSIRFLNSVNYNTLNYEVLEVIDDNNVLLQGLFPITETNLQFAIIGTFTPGVYPNSSQEQPFQYDSCLVTLVNETINNTPPVLNDGYEFYIARINNTTSTGLIIQDKRSDYVCKSYDFDFLDTINSVLNPLIGVENVRWDSSYTPQYKNIVEVAWSFRSQGWIVNTQNNTVTISSGNGGIYKTTNNFNSGDFNGWRVYAPDGSYSKITNSTISGNSIVLNVDALNINSYSPDGGITFYLNKYVVITPDVEEVEMIFTPNPSDTPETTNQIQRFSFKINEQIGRCDVLVYGTPNCSYVVTYRYKSFKRYSVEQLIPSDTDNGYYNEGSFDSYGNLLTSGTTKVTYTSSLTAGFIILTLATNAYKNLVFQVNKGDLKGINKITTLTAVTNIELEVGTNLNYLLFTGNIALSNNVNININLANIINGNEFIFQFNCSSFNLNGYSLIINIRNISTLTPIKTFVIGDFYQMLNTPNGIVIKAITDGITWCLSQNYDLGLPNQVIDLYNVTPNAIFDSVTKLGKIAGLFGYGIADGTTYNGITSPDLRGVFIVGYNTGDADYSTVGNTGGEKKHLLTASEIPPLNTPPNFASGPGSTTSAYIEIASSAASDVSLVVNGPGPATSHENRPPYFTLLKAYKLF